MVSYRLSIETSEIIERVVLFLVLNTPMWLPKWICTSNTRPWFPGVCLILAAMDAVFPNPFINIQRHKIAYIKLQLNYIDTYIPIIFHIYTWIYTCIWMTYSDLTLWRHWFMVVDALGIFGQVLESGHRPILGGAVLVSAIRLTGEELGEPW